MCYLLHYPFACHKLSRLILGSFLKIITIEEAGSLVSVAALLSIDGRKCGMFIANNDLSRYILAFPMLSEGHLRKIL
jgi:hypothetical protein